MKICRNCKKEITEKRNTFCSKSCAVSFNNRFRSIKVKSKEVKCKKCGKTEKRDSRCSSFICENCKLERKKLRKKDKTKNVKTARKEIKRKIRAIKCTFCGEKNCSNEICKKAKYSRKILQFLNFDTSSRGTKRALLEYKKIVKTLRNMYEIQKMSLTEIADIFHPKGKKYHEIFRRFMKNNGICLRKGKESLDNYLEKIGKKITDEKYVYWKNCQFRFSPYKYPNMEGYDLLLKYGIYHPIKNPNGITRDHIFSIYDGFKKGINPKYIRHPANCRLVFLSENSSKNTKSSISEKELFERIENWKKTVDKRAENK